MDRAVLASAPTTTRTLLPPTRALLLALSVLTALAFIALFVFSTRTAQAFAWTIDPPLTAAFLGAGYAAGCALVVLSLRDPVWANSRVPVLTILTFALLTLVATSLHLERFHFQPEFAGSPLVARAAAWFWTEVHVIVPVATVAILVTQQGAPGADPPRQRPVPPVLCAALVVESAVLLSVGIALFLPPASAGDLWPWPLTPLTARMVAAWLITIGLVTGLAAVAGDLARLRTAAIAYTVFGGFVLAALARHPGSVAWDRPVTWVFLLLALAVTGTGAAGWYLAPAPPPASEPAPTAASG
jgi:hypothetical protein